MSTAVAENVAVRGADRTVAKGSVSAWHLLLMLGQLAALLLILRQFQIESAAFLKLAVLAFGGFAVHAVLPLRYRLPFFLLLSFVGIGLVFGLSDGGTLVAIGLVLIAICHLPVAFGMRIAVLLAVVALLVAMRARWLPGLWSEAIWPILGSMFMFRLIVYLYDLKHDSSGLSLTRTLSYFFMLPNVCFPLFPVIDYKAFRRNYYDDDAYRIYQTGVDWMVRGVIHLLLYRYVYYYLTLSPAEVAEPRDLVQFVLSNFLLYLRVSGLFHLVVGMLYLFGFRLPETHHRYLLASSFTDFWRRINIYWKDFMLKIFYYPVVFRLRHLGATKAMVVATLFVFLMTWFLHAYQWFWLRGTALLAWQDILFWTILGGLVVVNGLWEARHGRQRSLSARTWSWRSFSTRALKTFATFCVICVLWSLWTTESLLAWFSMWTVVAAAPSTAVDPASPFLLAALALGTVAGRAATGSGKPGDAGRGARRFPWPSSRMLTGGCLVLLLLAGIESIHTQIGGTFSTVVNTLRSGKLSRLDQARLERGYYESLLAVNRFNSQLWEVYSRKPADWLDVEGTGLKQFTDTFIQTELAPSFVSRTRFGPYSVNRWGMRDKDYEKQPPAGTFRAAIMGPSTVAGWGVGDGETFEALLEARLNEEHSGTPFRKFEILNFGVPGYQPPQQVPAVEKALAFAPDAIFYVAHGREPRRSAHYLAEIMTKNVAIPYAPLRDIVEKAGVEPGMDETTAQRKLEPYKAEILAWVYRHIADRARAAGTVPVFFFLPQATSGSWEEENPTTFRLAEAAGFVVIDMLDVYEGHDIDKITLAEWDRHPNDDGHRLIAARMYQELSEKWNLIFKGNSGPESMHDR